MLTYSPYIPWCESISGLRVATMYSFASAIALMAYECSLGNIPLAQALRPIGVARTVECDRRTPLDLNVSLTPVGMACIAFWSGL